LIEKPSGAETHRRRNRIAFGLEHSDWGTDRGMHVPADVPPMANTTAPDYAKKLELQKFTGAARSALPSRRMSDPVSSVTH